MRFLALIIMICPFGGLNSLKWLQINSLAVIAKIFRKKIRKTRPSILCVTHQMMNYKWYLMVLGQYMTILAGTWSV